VLLGVADELPVVGEAAAGTVAQALEDELAHLGGQPLVFEDILRNDKAHETSAARLMVSFTTQLPALLLGPLGGHT
jgi:hypothetical protein